ncbi:MAG: hypothetical protein LLG02_04295 [Pelosinus sp.]|nr:hypothetical protein [Pelosinus sp.]
MLFRKKKTYEDVYKWRRHNNGTCFYCYEDKPVAYAFVGEKGICQECLANFKVGHAGTDRHVITYLTRSLTSHEETVEWLKKHGVKLAPNGQQKDVHYYFAINNMGIFNTYCAIIYGNVDISTVSIATQKRIMDSYNDIEIFKDGSIRIIY